MKLIKHDNSHWRYIGNDVTVNYNNATGTAKIISMHKPFSCTAKQAEDIADDINELRHVDTVKANRPKQGHVKFWRNRLYYSEGEKCCYVCDKFMKFEEATLEHIIPLALGGGNKEQNYALSHYECNIKKGDKL